ncbi:hypothetical protein SAMN05216411_1033 [Nitrosospira multiformis]|nr:hypothetical protein SAMN05216411_1033 [Nitrosospira multiformis]
MEKIIRENYGLALGTSAVEKSRLCTLHPLHPLHPLLPPDNLGLAILLLALIDIDFARATVTAVFRPPAVSRPQHQHVWQKL